MDLNRRYGGELNDLRPLRAPDEPGALNVEQTRDQAFAVLESTLDEMALLKTLLAVADGVVGIDEAARLHGESVEELERLRRRAAVWAIDDLDDRRRARGEGGDGIRA